jgi:YbgC/YbaW family acyl-CoA thioester hydrolase
MYKEFNYSTKILEHHLDAFGHVNNAKYFELYEEARWDFITSFGYGLNEVMKYKQGPVILDTSCRFKKEIVNRETITINSQTVGSPGKIMKINQKMLKEDGSVASEASFTIGFMDLKQRKLVDPPENWLKAIGVL